MKNKSRGIKVKKQIAFLLIVMLLSAMVFGCSKKPADVVQDSIKEDAANDITGGISEVDKVNSDLNIDEIDSELKDIDSALSGW